MFNLNAKPRFWCVDDFYEDPYAVRQLALNQQFHFDDFYRGKRTANQFLFPGLKERFESIINRKITKWEEHGMNGRFQHCTVNDQLVYHCDSQTWAAAIYLTPDAPPETGTTLWRHKRTKIRHQSEMHDGPNGYPFDKGFLDRTPYEAIDVVGNVFNRLVIWDGGSIHSASEYFGMEVADSRLFQIFFFD